MDWNFTSAHSDDRGYAKLVVNIADKNRVVGFHYLGPAAGEVTQGFNVGMLMGATKEDFDNAIAIHPTYAEVLFV